MPLSLILSQRVEQVNPCCCSPDSFAAHDCRSCAETPDDVPPTSLHSSQGGSTHRPCSDERREWSLGLGSQAILRNSRHRVLGSSDSGDLFPKSGLLKDGRSSRRTVGSRLVSAVQMARLSRNHRPLHFAEAHSPEIVESLNGGQDRPSEERTARGPRRHGNSRCTKSLETHSNTIWQSCSCSLAIATTSAGQWVHLHGCPHVTARCDLSWGIASTVGHRVCCPLILEVVLPTA